jgi:hypothetical protein
MVAEWLYDKNDEAKLYLYEDKIYNRSQQEIGFIEGHDVFSTGGEVIGSYISGVLYDSDNRPVAFTETAKGYIPELDDVIGSPGAPDFSDFEDTNTDYSEETGLIRPDKKNGLGHSGEPLHPVIGGWSDESVDDLFGMKL